MKKFLTITGFFLIGALVLTIVVFVFVSTELPKSGAEEDQNTIDVLIHVE